MTLINILLYSSSHNENWKAVDDQLKNVRWVNKYGSKLQFTLRKAITSELYVQGLKRSRRFPIIIAFNQKMTKGMLHSLNKRLGVPHVSMKNRLKLINAVSAKISADGIRKLCEEDCVACLYLDRKIKVYMDIAKPAVGSAIARTAGLTGKEVGIAIIDTGIYPHPDITRPKNRIIAFRDFVNNHRRPYDDNGHGTHVAGIAAGNGRMSKGKFQGLATKANLVGLKVLDKNGAGYTSDVIRGIEWVIRNRNRYKIRVINLSLGTDGPIRCSDDPLCQATSSAWKSGIVVAAAAGNNGPRSRTIGAPGNNPMIITVGAVDDKNTVRQSDDVVARFSSRGPAGRINKPDVVAPGVNIVSLRIPRNYKGLSGTSMATPIVSGVAALLLQRNPKMRPGQVKDILKRNAFNLGAGRNAQGSGEINIRFLAAVRKRKRK